MKYLAFCRYRKENLHLSASEKNPKGTRNRRIVVFLLPSPGEKWGLLGGGKNTKTINSFHTYPKYLKVRTFALTDLERFGLPDQRDAAIYTCNFTDPLKWLHFTSMGKPCPLYHMTLTQRMCLLLWWWQEMKEVLEYFLLLSAFFKLEGAGFKIFSFKILWGIKTVISP